MAAYTPSRSTHKTLTANTVDTVTLGSQWQQVLVTNRTGTNEIYFTADGTVPTVGGDGTYVLPTGISNRVVAFSTSEPVNPYGAPVINGVISLISAGAMAYSVEGII